MVLVGIHCPLLRMSEVYVDVFVCLVCELNFSDGTYKSDCIGDILDGLEHGEATTSVLYCFCALSHEEGEIFPLLFSS